MLLTIKDLNFKEVEEIRFPQETKDIVNIKEVWFNSNELDTLTINRVNLKLLNEVYGFMWVDVIGYEYKGKLYQNQHYIYEEENPFCILIRFI